MKHGIVMVLTALTMALTSLTAWAQNAAANHKPQVYDLLPKYYVDEQAAEGTIVGTLTVVDKDKNEDGEYETLTYRVLMDENSNVESNVFELEETANDKGVRTVNILVKKNATLDYETKSQYVTKIEIKDMLNTYVTETLTVRLRNVNEAPTAGDQMFIKPEKNFDGSNWPGGELVGKITTAADPDGDPLTYELVDAAGLPFAMNAGTNEIVIVAGDKLDYETKSSYTFKVKASDGKLNTTFNITVNLNDVNEPPTIDQVEKVYTVNENSEKGVVVGTFVVKDFDNGEVLTYTLTGALDGAAGAQNSLNGKTLADIFEVKETANQNGTRTVSILVKDKSLLDYEALYNDSKNNATYPVTITVKDSKNHSATATTSIAVQDVNEALTATGGTFYIQEHSPGMSHVGTISYNGNLSESDYGRVIGVDADKYSKAFGTLAFAMSTANTGSDAESFFVDPNDGCIYTSIDAEFEADGNGAKKEYTFKVTVSDGAFSKDVPVTVNVLDIEEALTNEENHAPVAEDLTVDVAETINGGTVVGTISASDPDAATSTVVGFYTLHYSIVDPTGLPFEINQNTGEIKLKKNERLHYAQKDRYEFNVKVSDRATSEPPKSTTVTVTINVSDVNETPVIMGLADLYEVRENTSVGDVFGSQIIVYDEDAADVATSNVCKFDISIEDQDACTKYLCAEDLFKVVRDGNTNSKHETPFKFAVKNDLDYEALYKGKYRDAIFNVTIIVTDADGNTISQDTKIRVVDVNEEPYFKENSYEFRIPENVNGQTSLGTVETLDPDIWSPQLGTLSHSLEGDDAAPFWIDPSTGELSTIANANLDYETKSTYEFNAVVTDNTSTKKVSVKVKVGNVDEAPVFPEEVPLLAVNENSIQGDEVGVLAAYDDDCKNNPNAKKPTYTLAATDISTRDYKSFAIDKNTGQIKVKGDLNYEEKSLYSVRVVATDSDDPTLSTYVDAIIKIKDVNDQPTFSEREYTFKVYEDAGVGSVVDTVTVHDEDVWAEHKYELSDYEDGSKDAEFFQVNSEGIIRVHNKKLEKNRYQVVLKATDNGKSRGFQNYTAATLVSIDVIDPMFAGVAELYEVDEGATIGTTLNTNIEVTVDYRGKDKDKVQKPEPRIEGQNDAGTAKAEDMFDVKLTENGDQWTFAISVKDKLNYIDLYNPDTKDAVFNVTLIVKDPFGLSAAAKTKIKVNGEKPEITFGEGQIWRTYYDTGGSYLVPDGVKAYVVTGLNAAGTAVVIRQVSYLKKGVVLLLQKCEGATSEPNPDEEFEPNLLKIVTGKIVPAVDGIYVLYMNEFLKVANRAIEEHTRYLDLTGVGSAARSLMIDGMTTTVEDRPLGVEPGEVVWYTIGGQRIEKPTKPGLYIKRSAGRGEKLRK